MTSTRVVKAAADGRLEALHVVGFHGQVGMDQTPARRGPVYADETGRLVRLLEVKPANGGYEVRVERDERPVIEGSLPGIGTPLRPWQVHLDHFVAILGERECAVANQPRAGNAWDEPPRVDQFVKWIAGKEPISEELNCERINGLIAWYCAPDEAFALWKRIQPIAEANLYKALSKGFYDEIRSASFWLSRAKVSDRDIYLAAAALKRAASPHAEVLLKQGLRDRSEEQRRTGLAQAEEVLAARLRAVGELSKPPVIGPGLKSRTDLRARFLVKAAA